MSTSSAESPRVSRRAPIAALVAPLAAALVVCAGCASAPDSRGAGGSAAAGAAAGREKEDVEAALRRYGDLVLAMDHAGIAALFEPEGEIVNQGRPPIHGRAAIETFLSGFAGYRVLENDIGADTTTIRGDTAEQVGTYRQRVRAPDGREISVTGGFDALWARAPSGAWLIRRMGTTPR